MIALTSDLDLGALRRVDPAQLRQLVPTLEPATAA